MIKWYISIFRNKVSCFPHYLFRIITPISSSAWCELQILLINMPWLIIILYWRVTHIYSHVWCVFTWKQVLPSSVETGILNELRFGIYSEFVYCSRSPSYICKKFKSPRCAILNMLLIMDIHIEVYANTCPIDMQHKQIIRVFCVSCYFPFSWTQLYYLFYSWHSFWSMWLPIQEFGKKLV